MSNIIENLLVNNIKKSMLESIDGIDDIDFLKRELKEHLRKEFDLQQRIDKAIEYLNLSSPAHWGSENELQLLSILEDDKN